MESEPKSVGYYSGLTRKIVIIILVVSVIPLVLISGVIRYYFQASYQEKVQDHLKVLIKKHRQNIDTFLKEKLADVLVICHTHPFERLSNDEFLRQQLDLHQSAIGKAFVDLGLVDDTGRLASYAGPFNLKGADYADTPWFKEAFSGASYISDVFPGLRGSPHFIVAVTREFGGRKWLLRATVNFDEFNQLVENIRIGSTGFAFILNSKGEFQTRPRMDLQLQAESYRQFLTKLPQIGDETLFTELSLSDRGDYIFVIAGLKSDQWLLVFQQEASDTYSALYQARLFIIIVFAVGIVSIFLVAAVLSKQVVLRIRQADREKEMMTERVIEAGKLASLGELAAGIAHEINNPVAVMVEEAGWMEDLLSEEDLQNSKNFQEFSQSLSQIRTQGSRCKQITHKLLSFARKTDPNPQLLNPAAMINEVVSLCQQRARYASVKITSEVAADLPPFSASPSEMQQVIMNLVINSLDAIDNQGGHIVVRARAEEGRLIIDVADDGPGIPEAYLSRIFDPFFTTKPPGKGTGLGLSICYGIVTKMGGEIRVNSAPQMGTTFSIRLPLAADVQTGPAAVTP